MLDRGRLRWSRGTIRRLVPTAPANPQKDAARADAADQQIP